MNAIDKLFVPTEIHDDEKVVEWWWTGGHWSRDEVKVFNTVTVFTNIEPFPPPGGTCLTYLAFCLQGVIFLGKWDTL